MNTIFLEGGCYAVFGCSHHDDEWLEENHTAILKYLESLSCETVSTKTKRLHTGNIRLSYTIESLNELSLEELKTNISSIITCDEKESLYIQRENTETGQIETKPPNYPHLVISKNPVQQVNLKYEFEYSDIPKRRCSFS